MHLRSYYIRHGKTTKELIITQEVGEVEVNLFCMIVNRKPTLEMCGLQYWKQLWQIYGIPQAFLPGQLGSGKKQLNTQAAGEHCHNHLCALGERMNTFQLFSLSPKEALTSTKYLHYS